MHLQANVKYVLTHWFGFTCVHPILPAETLKLLTPGFYTTKPQVSAIQALLLSDPYQNKLRLHLAKYLYPFFCNNPPRPWCNLPVHFDLELAGHLLKMVQFEKLKTILSKAKESPPPG